MKNKIQKMRGAVGLSEVVTILLVVVLALGSIFLWAKVCG